MSLIVCIETAAPTPVFVLGDGGEVLFSDAPSGRIEGPIYLRDKVLESLGANGRDRSEIDYLAVDLGPGGLTATRSGVTFANALAYGLGKPLIPLGYFDLVGTESLDAFGDPVLCVRETTDGDAFTMVLDENGPGALEFGNLEERCRELCQAYASITLAGVVKPTAEAHFDGKLCYRVGSRVPRPETLLRSALARIDRGDVSVLPFEPVTSESPGIVRRKER